MTSRFASRIGRLFRMSLLNGCFGALAATSATADTVQGVKLTWPSPFGAGVEALPRLAGQDAATRRVNAMLNAADERLRRAVAACARTSLHPHDSAAAWERHVGIAAQGPRFLSLVVQDQSFCGGAHPDSGTTALVFDLRSGRLVDWAKLLPETIVQSTSLDGALDGGKVGLVNSDALAAAYQRLYPATAQNGVAAADWQTCREAVGMSHSFVLWPEATPRGLALQPADLPHIVAACGVPVVLLPAALRQLGVDTEVIKAFDAAY